MHFPLPVFFFFSFSLPSLPYCSSQSSLPYCRILPLCSFLPIFTHIYPGFFFTHFHSSLQRALISSHHLSLFFFYSLFSFSISSVSPASLLPSSLLFLVHVLILLMLFPSLRTFSHLLNCLDKFVSRESKKREGREEWGMERGRGRERGRGKGSRSCQRENDYQCPVILNW